MAFLLDRETGVNPCAHCYNWGLKKEAGVA